MNLKHRLDTATCVTAVAPRKVPGHGKPDLRCCFEHDPVSPSELLCRHPTAERIVHMRIGPRLVQQHLTTPERRDQFGKLIQECRGISCGSVVPAWRDVLDFPKMQTLDDLIGAIPVVLIKVEDADALGIPLRLEMTGRDDEAIEGTEAGGRVVLSVVKAGDRRARHAAVKHASSAAAIIAPDVYGKEAATSGSTPLKPLRIRPARTPST